jgi:DNA-binding transcriptional LysR family regulator
MVMKLEIAIIRQLPYFVAVAEELNFQRASERLSIAQSALSRRIRDLEHDLGEVPLFVRLARGVKLTASGETLLEDARKILALVEAAGHRAQQAVQGEYGRVRIAYSPGAIRNRFIADIFKAFGGAIPNVDTETSMLSIENILAGVRDRSFLAGLLYIDEVDPDLCAVDIAQEEFYLALPVGHHLATAEKIFLADLLHEDFILHSRFHAPAVRRQLERQLEVRGAKLRIAMESPSSEATLGLVSKGMGLGFGPVSAHWFGAFSEVALRRIEDFQFSARFKMLWLAANESPILPRLVDAATKAVQDFQGSVSERD